MGRSIGRRTSVWSAEGTPAGRGHSHTQAANLGGSQDTAPPRDRSRPPPLGTTPGFARSPSGPVGQWHKSCGRGRQPRVSVQVRGRVARQHYSARSFGTHFTCTPGCQPLRPGRGQLGPTSQLPVPPRYASYIHPCAQRVEEVWRAAGPCGPPLLPEVSAGQMCARVGLLLAPSQGRGAC